MTSQAIIVCTRDRPEDLRRCLPSVLRARVPGSPIVIVDQSRGDESEAVVRTAMADHDGIDYVRSTRTGAATARNEGAERVEQDLLLFTDDDCEVDVRWAESWSEVFGSNPRLGLAFGEVAAPDYDIATGTIPTFDAGLTDRIFGVEVLHRGPISLGMGANMAVRRSVWKQAGGFDEYFGPGTEFPAAEETNLAVRVLGLDHDIAHAPGPRVLHHGFRPGSEPQAFLWLLALGWRNVRQAHPGGRPARDPLGRSGFVETVARDHPGQPDRDPTNGLQRGALLRQGSAAFDPQVGRQDTADVHAQARVGQHVLIAEC